MKEKQRKKLNKFLFMAIVLTVVVNVVAFLLVKQQDELQTSLVRQYGWGSTQCVAYVQKYYKDVFDVEISSVGRAQDIYLKAPKYNLFAHRNGGSVAPQPGNIIVFEHRNKIGHVAIITGRLHDGVLIAEQNWGTSRITTNGNFSLLLTRENGGYFVHDRDQYKVLGWVGLNLKNPETSFDFSSDNFDFWIGENNVKNVTGDNRKTWAFNVTGGSPSIISPVFIKPLKIRDFSWFVFKAGSLGENFEDPRKGNLHLRDEKDQWRSVIPFEIRQVDELSLYVIDLSVLRDDFAVTQVRIELPGYSRRSGNLWKFDWAEFSKTKIEEE